MTYAARPDVAEIDDPFAAFDVAGGIGLVEDIYPRLAELRAAGPAHEGTLANLLGVPGLGPELREGPTYSVVTHEAVTGVLRDHETFSSARYAEMTDLVFGPVIVAMDEPEHHRQRALVQQAFTRSAVERWRTRSTAPILDATLDQLAPQRRGELVRDLTFRFPIQVIADVLGLPSSDLTWFHTRAVEVILLFSDIERGLRGAEALRGYFADVLAERRAEGGRAGARDDVIQDLLDAELDGRRLTDDEVIGFLLLLLPAGAETTYRGSSNMLFALLTHPEQLAAVRDDPALVPAVVEETLRWECTPTQIGRVTTRPVRIGDVELPEDAFVGVSLASANHDETVWPDPERFDVTREPRQHLAFATGVHMCLGMHLARMEMATCLERVLARLPNLRLDSDAEPPRMTGAAFRTPTALPAVWD